MRPLKCYRIQYLGKRGKIHVVMTGLTLDNAIAAMSRMQLDRPDIIIAVVNERTHVKESF